MTPEEAYEKATNALEYVQFIDNTYKEGFKARNEVEKLLVEFYKDMAQLLLERQNKITKLQQELLGLYTRTVSDKLKEVESPYSESSNLFLVLSKMIMDGTTQEKEYATKKLDEWFTENQQKNFSKTSE